jgi:hypothetical protein
MATKKSTPKRANGAEKPKAAKVESRQASPKAKARKTASAPPPEPAPNMMSDEEIARRAYALWESRGRPDGSPDEDWHRAKEQLGR